MQKTVANWQTNLSLVRDYSKNVLIYTSDLSPGSSQQSNCCAVGVIDFIHLTSALRMVYIMNIIM